MKGERILQPDLVRAGAILSVIVLHSLTREELIRSFGVLHVWQSVPIFLILMGFHAARSFPPGWRLRIGDLPSYWRKRSTRLLAPFVPIWLFIWLLGSARDSVTFSWESLLLKLVYPAPGNYFVALALTFALGAPLLQAWWGRSPFLTGIAFVGLDLGFELWAAGSAFFDAHPYVYSAAFPRFLVAYGLGMFLADERVSKRVKTGALAVLAAGSLVYLVGVDRAFVPTFFRPDWYRQNLFAAPYAASLVWAVLLLAPSSSRSVVIRGLAEFGRWSYQIFLVQMGWFAVVGQAKSAYVFVNLAATVVCGMGMVAIERWLAAARRDAAV